MAPAHPGDGSRELSGDGPDADTALDHRLVGPGADETERAAESALRPKSLRDFVGQQVVRDQLSIVLESARARGRAVSASSLIKRLPYRTERAW